MTVIQTKTVFAGGQIVTLSTFDGKTWAMKTDALAAFHTRVTEVPQLNPKQREWLDLVELPTNGHDVRHAIRSHGGAL